MQTLTDLLRIFKPRGRKTALVYVLNNQRSSFSYGELYDHSLRLANWLKQQGIAEGDRVAFALPDSPLAVVSFFAIIAAGAVAVPINLALTQEEVQAIIRHSGCKLAIAVASVYNPKIKSCAWVIQEQLPTIIEQAKPLDIGDTNMHPEDLAEILYTSGSTGQEKGVCLSHRNLAAAIAQHSARLEGLGPESNILSVMSFSQNYGQLAGTLVPLALGATVVFAQKANFSDMLEVWARENISSMFAVPGELKFFKQVLESMQPLPRGSLIQRLKSNFKFFTCGGYALEPEVFEFWENLGMPVLESYGMTECSHVANSSLHDSRPGSAGKPLPGVEVKIDNEEILVKGDNVFVGYWQNPPATQEAFNSKGWYKTKDLGKLEGGYLTILGRREEAIGPQGAEVMPSAVEAVLNSIEGVKDSCVVGKLMQGQEQIHAVLILEDESSDASNIIAQANKQLPQQSFIQSFTVWQHQTFPKTVTSKIQRFKVSRLINDYVPLRRLS
jgi:long-chain acyl-CoA synthetase